MPTLICLLLLCGALSPVTDMRVTGSGQQLEWFATNVGYVMPVSPPPSARSQSVELQGAGSGIGGPDDAFYFLYAELEHDAVITARLWNFTHPNQDAKAGLMLRTALDPDSVNVFAYVSGQHLANVQARTGTGEETVPAEPVTDLGPSTWLQLGRWGSEVVGQYSEDGFEWRELGRYRLAFDGPAYVGLAVTSATASELVVATFTDLQVETANVGAPPQPPAAAPGLAVDHASGTSNEWICSSRPLSPSYAPTIYVSTTGDDGNDGRTSDRPLRTMQAAADMAVAGDVVWVKDGVYEAPIVLAGTGTAEAPIVFESSPGECAVIDGTSASNQPAVKFENASHYVFRNFEVRNSAEQGILLTDSSDVLVSHVRSFENGLSGIQNIGGERNRFTHFIVHDNSDGTRGDADGIGISSGRGHRIDNCVAFRNSDDGVDAWRSYGTIIERCIAFENGLQGGNGNGFKAGGGLANGNAELRYNIAFDNTAEGFTYNGGYGILFENNTSFNNGSYGFSAAKSTLSFNLAFNNGDGDWMDDGDNRQEGNSWNIDLTEPDFVSVDRHSQDFLALDGDRGGSADGSGESAAEWIGALPPGETILSYLGIDLPGLLAR